MLFSHFLHQICAKKFIEIRQSREVQTHPLRGLTPEAADVPYRFDNGSAWITNVFG
jgi:hypothetical protein